MIEDPAGFAIDSFVLLRYPAGLGNFHRPPTKLHTRWQGPFKVINRCNDAYTIQNLVTSKVSKHHAKELSAFKWNAEVTNPREIALTDQDEFVIDHIVEHRGDFKRKSTLSFKVHWTGYDQSEDTWEPWNNLRDTEQLHAYLRHIGEQQHIPKKFSGTN